MNKKILIGGSSLVLLLGGSAVALHSSGSPAHSSIIQSVPDPSPASSAAGSDSQTVAGSDPQASQTDQSTATNGSVANTNGAVAPANSTPADIPADNPPAPSPAPVPKIVARSNYYFDTGTKYDQHCVWNYDNGDSVDKIVGSYLKGSVKIAYDCPDSP